MEHAEDECRVGGEHHGKQDDEVEFLISDRWYLLSLMQGLNQVSCLPPYIFRHLVSKAYLSLNQAILVGTIFLSQ